MLPSRHNAHLRVTVVTDEILPPGGVGAGAWPVGAAVSNARVQPVSRSTEAITMTAAVSP